MKLLFWRKSQGEEDSWDRLSEAERESRRVIARAHRVADSLEARKRHNHWSEAIDGLLRGGS